MIYSADGKTLVLVLPTDVKAIVVPKEVVYIASGAFTAAKELELLGFEDGSMLAEIGDSVFVGCNKLTTVNLPANEIKIGAYAFNGVEKLSKIDLSHVTEIGKYAFGGTALTELNVAAGTVIGAGAFKNTASLTTLTLGEGVKVGDGAFEGSALVTVELDGDAVIGNSAFKNCVNLSTFDFADVTGTLGDYAFFGCTSLTAVVAPKITVIGEGCFAGCLRLKTLEADELVTIGDYAFYDKNTNLTQTNTVTYLTTLNLPKLETVGDYAFAASNALTSVDLPALTTLGEMCFAMCQNLVTASLSEKVTVIPARAFYACLKLTDFDFTNIEHVGTLAFGYVKLPKKLVLPNVVTLEMQAFAEAENYHYIESVEAPKLAYVAEQAFINCVKLRRFNAPVIEYIGNYAFAQTALVEFEISNNLTTLEDNAFISSTDFEEFYAVIDGEKVYDVTFDTVMLKDGVLYVENARGYTLYCYPMAKSDSVFYVADGTTKIGYQAASGNTYLESVVFPSTLRTIADFAFYGCTALTTVTFKSYYAPTLEGMPSVARDELKLFTVDNVDQFPGFDELYKYNYSFVIDGWTSRNIYHANFKAGIGSVNATKMTAIIPENSFGYGSLVYSAYFNVSEISNSGAAPGKYAIAFLEAVYNLPENVDRFDKLLVDAAINAYNALEAHESEKGYVDEATYAKFERIRAEYNVDVVEGLIKRLFDMYNSEYCFNTLKSATDAYLALADDERENVEGADVLETSRVALAAKMGVSELDFTLTYSENLDNATPPENDPPKDEKPKEEPISMGTVVIIVVSVAAVIAAAAFVFILLKKKKSAAAPKATENKSVDTVATDAAEATAETTNAEEATAETTDAEEDTPDTEED